MWIKIVDQNIKPDGGVLLYMMGDVPTTEGELVTTVNW